VVICLVRGAYDLRMVQLMPLPPHHLLLIKIQNGLPFWCWLTQLVLGKRPLNRSICSSTVKTVVMVYFVIILLHYAQL